MAALADMRAHSIHETSRLAGRQGGRELIESYALEILSASEAPLNILRAPAGFGKTCCLEQLSDKLQAEGVKARWCDPENLDETFQKSAGATFLVDFGSADAADGLKKCLEHARSGTGAIIIVAVRGLSDLNWVEHELGGIVKIIGPRDLTFSIEQIARQFRELPPGRSGDFRAKDLYAATGGWPLAVGLAAERANSLGAKWSGDTASLVRVDHCRRIVNSTILAHLPQGLRDVLQALAGLQLISPSIAAPVLGRPVEMELGQALDRFGLMIESAVRPGYYQLNPLVREALQKPEGIDPATLKKAASWYLKNDLAEEAIEHYLAADEPKLACEALHETGSHILRNSGDIIRMSRWIDRIESAKIELPATLRLWRTWALTLSQRLEEAAAELDKADALLKACPDSADEAYADRLRVGLASRRGDLDEVEARGAQWLETWCDLEPHSAVGVCIMMAMAKGYYHDELAQRRMLMKAREHAIRCGNHPSNLWILAFEALAELDAGRAKLASEFADRAMEACIRLCGTETPIYSLLTVLSARVHLELGNLDKAGDLLDEGFLASRSYSLPETNLTAQVARTAILEARFGCDRAISSIHESSLIGDRYREFGDVLAAEVLVRHGRIEEARLRLDLLSEGLAPEDRGNLGHEYRTVECMLLVAEKKYDQASEILMPLLEHADAHGQKRRAVRLLLLRAACEWRLDREATARQFFSRAIAIAATGPLYMTVSNLGWAVREMIARASNRDAANSQANLFVTTLKKQMKIEDEFRELEEREPVIVPLTPREREIVSLLDSSMKVPEIASYLELGVSTLKWHLRNIYGKLCVSNRSGAVAVARRCAII